MRFFTEKTLTPWSERLQRGASMSISWYAWYPWTETHTLGILWLIEGHVCSSKYLRCWKLQPLAAATFWRLSCDR